MQEAQHAHELRLMTLFTQFLATRQPPGPMFYDNQVRPPIFAGFHTDHAPHGLYRPFRPNHAHAHFETTGATFNPNQANTTPFHVHTASYQQGHASTPALQPEGTRSAPFNQDHAHTTSFLEDLARPLENGAKSFSANYQGYAAGPSYL